MGISGIRNLKKMEKFKKKLVWRVAKSAYVLKEPVSNNYPEALHNCANIKKNAVSHIYNKNEEKNRYYIAWSSFCTICSRVAHITMFHQRIIMKFDSLQKQWSTLSRYEWGSFSIQWWVWCSHSRTTILSVLLHLFDVINAGRGSVKRRPVPRRGRRWGAQDLRGRSHREGWQRQRSRVAQRRGGGKRRGAHKLDLLWGWYIVLVQNHSFNDS